MDCSLCLLPSKKRTVANEGESYDDIPDNEISRDKNRSQLSVQNRQSLGPPGCIRDPQRTLWAQIIVADRCQSNPAFQNSLLPTDVSAMRTFLRPTSASEYPTASAAIYGLGSLPNRLYRSVGIDRQYSFDLGPGRDLPDFAFKVFSNRSYNKGVFTKAQLARAANRRFLELPIVKQLNLTPFRMTANEVHSCMTASLRQKSFPFLWVVFLALQPNTKPDDDKLLQSALILNNIQIIWRGINQRSEQANLTLEEIRSLQHNCHQVCSSICECLDMRISTKYHRLMWHITDYVTTFGYRRRGDTDANESLHRSAKRAYKATNKKLNQLATQILSSRNPSQISYDTNTLGSPEGNIAELLVNQSSVQNETVHRYEIEEPNETTVARYNAITYSLLQLLRGQAVESISNILLSQKIGSAHRSFWKQLKSFKFNSVIPWLTEEEIQETDTRTIIYAGENILVTGKRYDAVEYNHGRLLRCGILQICIEGRPLIGEDKMQLAVIRRLRIADLHEGNCNITEKYGRIRYAYHISNTGDKDVVLDCVGRHDMRRSLAILPDMDDLSIRYSPTVRVSEILDNKFERRCAHFLSVPGYQVTSNSEYEL